MRFIYNVLSSQAVIKKLRQELREKKEKVVVVSGCFDILHIGHLTYLEYAAKLGTKLIVGINNDRSVKALKGENRPINNERYRSELIGALRIVDYVYIYDNTRDFLDMIQPDIWVKGADYSIQTLDQDELQTVLKHGGQVFFAPITYRISTTDLAIKQKQ